jgi:acyl-CoA thioester hydrolase
MSSGSLIHRTELRVRYSETDQMGTFYNSRVLEWFEVARTECLRAAGLSYREMEQRGALLPLVEAGVKYQGRAKYDDLLWIETQVTMAGRASVRFEHVITQAANGAAVATGFTLHAITDGAGRAMRPPSWLVALFASPSTPSFAP